MNAVEANAGFIINCKVVYSCFPSSFADRSRRKSPVTDVTPDTVIGKDGKPYPARRMPVRRDVEDDGARSNTHQAIPWFWYSMWRLKLVAMLCGTGEPLGSEKHNATASPSSGLGTPRRRMSSFDSSNSFPSEVNL